MTAIAYKDGILATDSQSTVGGLSYRPPVEKVRIIDSDIGPVFVTGAGEANLVESFMDWAERDGATDAYPRWSGRDNTAVQIFLPNGELVLFEGSGREEMGRQDYDALGCFQFLMGALTAGVSAIEAVELACETDVNCGYPIYVYQLGREDIEIVTASGEPPVPAVRDAQGRLVPKNDG